MIKLVKPDILYKESFIKALKAFQLEGWPWYLDLDAENINNNFQAYVDDLTSAASSPGVHGVCETRLWADYQGQFAGFISIRHQLTPALRKFGGNIGYETAPEFRQKGIASEMLRLALPIAKKIGLNEALLTCDDDNVASIKVIEKNGGTLKEKKFFEMGKPLKRYYWIQLT